MAITRYQGPVNMLQQLNQEMNELASRWFARPMLESNMPAWPTREGMFTPVAIEESDAELIVKMDVPGAKAEEIKVDCKGQLLTISGERKHEKSEQKGETHYTERQYGSFMRRLSLPAAVKQDAINARYKDGVLEIHLPKAEPSKAKAIKVDKG
jgi:HSP20 family protein